MKKALLIGDYVGAPYHPLAGVDEALKSILSEQLDLAITDQYEDLEGDNLNGYDLLIIYNDCWEKPITQAQVAGIISFISKGGGIVVLHSGMSLHDHVEMAHLYGAKFAGHPEFCELKFSLAKDHVITDGLTGFTMGEEPYMYTWSPFAQSEIILTYDYEGEKKPAGWAHEYGLGRFVQLMPGHTKKSFELEAYQKLIQRSCAWACREI